MYEVDENNFEMLMEEWVIKKENLAELREMEMALRKAICLHLLDGKETGKYKDVDFNGMTLEAQIPTKYTMNRKYIEDVREVLSPKEFDAVITLSATVKKTGLAMLDKDEAQVLSGFIDLKPSTPSIKLTPNEEK